MERALLPISFLTLLAAGWLAVMEIVLRHSGFTARIAIALCIAAVSAATPLTAVFRSSVRAKRPLYAVGGVILMAIGVQAFLRNARAAHFEGFVFVIASAIVLQGLLMVLSLATRATHAIEGPAL
ncbi:MAG: hypothetical protein WCE63_07305 [Acidobacteriaceae bacterium]